MAKDGLVAIDNVDGVTALGFWLVSSGLGVALAHLLLGGLREAAREARGIADNPAMQLVYTGRGDEVGSLLFALQTLRAQLRTVLGRIRESACTMADGSVELNETACRMNRDMQTQQREIDMIATAAEEMSAQAEDLRGLVHRERTDRECGHQLCLTWAEEHLENRIEKLRGRRLLGSAVEPVDQGPVAGSGGEVCHRESPEVRSLPG